MRIFGLTLVLARESDRIFELPGYDAAPFDELPSKFYSGYFRIPKKNAPHLHYFFVESESNPKTDPVMLWMNGGPGASSILGLFGEIGPFRVDDRSYADQDRVTGLLRVFKNPHNWNQKMNLLIFESPGGTGLSYCENDEGGFCAGDECCEVFNDVSATSDAFSALTQFFDGFPHLKGNDFYISGESYAGVYIPMLAEVVLENSDLKLQGVLVGNGCVGIGTKGGCGLDENRLFLEFMFSHGQLSKEVRRKTLDTCGDLLDQGAEAIKLDLNCERVWNSTIQSLGSYNVYHIYDTCQFRGDNFRLRGENFRRLQGLNDYACGTQTAMYEYFNNERVKSVLKIPRNQSFKDHDGHWSHYVMTQKNVKPIYRKLMANGIRVLIFFGDVDASVPHTSGEEWIENENYTVSEKRRPWSVDYKTTAGYVEKFENGLFTYCTIRGAGHMVPLYKPREAFEMMEKFVLQEDFKEVQQNDIPPYYTPE